MARSFFLPSRTAQMLTGKDNRTHDIVRLLGAIVIVVGLLLQIYATIRQVPFDLQAYGLGTASMLMGLGGSLKIKESTEPDEGPDE